MILDGNNSKNKQREEILEEILRGPVVICTPADMN